MAPNMPKVGGTFDRPTSRRLNGQQQRPQTTSSCSLGLSSDYSFITSMTKEGGQPRGPAAAAKKSMKMTAGGKSVAQGGREENEHRISNARQNQLGSRSEPFGFEDENVDSPASSINDDGPVMPKGRKRSYVPPEEEQPQDFGLEMQKMLECFGADITRTLVTKRKRLEQFTQNSLKTSNKKVEDIWKGQQLERGKLNEEFRRQMMNVFQQWDADVEKSKEQEEKLLNLFKQQQKLFQQGRIVQSQRLKTVRQLHEQYSKGADDLEKCHQDQQSSVQAELKKEMALLQKKILMDTQQQEMANVKKSLQTMLF